MADIGGAISPEVHDSNKDESYEMTSAGQNGVRMDRSTSRTAVDSSSTGRPRSVEQQARRRFLDKFRKRKDKEADVPEASSGKHNKFTFGNQLKASIFNSWINLLLLAAPVGIALHFVEVSPAAVFVVNFIAIIPLAALLSYATEEIALRVGETLGGLLNATFGYV